MYPTNPLLTSWALAQEAQDAANRTESETQAALALAQEAQDAANRIESEMQGVVAMEQQQAAAQAAAQAAELVCKAKYGNDESSVLHIFPSNTATILVCIYPQCRSISYITLPTEAPCTCPQYW